MSLDKNDFLKFVVDTEDDAKEFQRWVFSHDYLNCNIAVGTFWGSEISYQKLMASVIKTAWQMPGMLSP